MTQRNNVRPFALPLTEADAREKLAKPLLSMCSTHGPTRVSKAVGCDERTIRNARDERSTLRIDYASNLLALDGEAFDPILNHFGRKSVPIDAVCSTDTDHSRQSKVLKAALALSIALEDGEITPVEVRQNRETITAARDALDALLAKLVRAA